MGLTHAPFLRNRNPEAEMGGTAPTAGFCFDILDGYSDVIPSTLRFYVNGTQAYNGVVWLAPFGGSIQETHSFDGYDGYRVQIDHPTLAASSRVTLRIMASDSFTTPMDETYGFWIAPALVSAEVDPYEITLKLVFSGIMREDSLLNAALFTLSGNAYTRKVDVLAPDTVRLWVERLQGEGPFTLTASSAIRDSYDGYLFGTSATVPIFQSTALLSNTDGMVRSWHSHALVKRDSRRAYFAGLRGVDVFDIQYGEGNASRWGQILDAYGIQACYLMNTADSYSFMESDIPRLGGQQPVPFQTGVPVDTTIMFTVFDNITAIETVSLVVYVNGILAFGGGAGGWANNWGGQITVRPHALDVELYPPADFLPGSTVTVRVLANDMLGHLADRSYTFTTAA